MGIVILVNIRVYTNIYMIEKNNEIYIHIYQYYKIFQLKQINIIAYIYIDESCFIYKLLYTQKENRVILANKLVFLLKS